MLIKALIGRDTRFHEKMSIPRFFGAESGNHRTRCVGVAVNSTVFFHARASALTLREFSV
jgi:hypothetical protein